MAIEIDRESQRGTAMPYVVVEKRLLYLPAAAEAWDVEFTSSNKQMVSIRPGWFRYEADQPKRARMLRSTEWMRIDASGELPPQGTVVNSLMMPTCEIAMPIVATSTPDAQYLVGEELLLQMVPAGNGFHELAIRRVEGESVVNSAGDASDQRLRETAGDDSEGGESIRTIVQGSRHRFKRGLEPGKYTIRTRWLPTVDRWGGDIQAWSPWSKPLELKVYRKRDEAVAMEKRIAEHRLSLMADRDANGVVTVTDPWSLPPNCPDEGVVKWFRTPCYEGSSMLVNELPDYYRDPFEYYLESIRSLMDRGFVFRAWNELLESPVKKGDREVILQFDLDAGPKSFAQLYPKLREMGIKASVMVHRRCYDWYAYDIEQIDIKLLQDAERAGWTIGYHNNSIGNVQRQDRAGDYGDDVLKEAQRQFVQDVGDLRQWFNIKVFTHHGGNVINHRMPTPAEANVVCVDKTFNQELWQTIDRSFSDGSFTSRPKPLRERLAEFDHGRFFIRNHPVKYGNYVAEFDVPPLVAEDIEKVGGRVTPELQQQIASEIEKQTRWLDDRLTHRAVGGRITRASHHKPLTAQMRSRKDIAPIVARFYEQRGEKFVRQSPWMWGDPRVQWWRVLDAFSPKSGKILNVGAMPPDRRAETIDFVGSADVIEMDIDPARRPDVLGDITNPPGELLGTFDCVLLFGLTIIHTPSRAVEACRLLTKPGGVALFGFAADTHPVRGGMWDPVMRPVWKSEREPLENIGLKGHMWSFDERAIGELFSAWDEYQFEFFADMFYVVARV